ncbi:MAG: thioredoxin family protein [Bacteroidales bacterium]|nr:thioredoxin family protein [Bacteroidales bacterium]
MKKIFNLYIKSTILIFLLLALSPVKVSAISPVSPKGINFTNLPWSEAVELAKSEKRLIFIDFYTDWCGPCLTMAEEVFVLPVVYSYYNNTFINLKIDAEKGEGIALAKRYGVNLFPTYLFIDPTIEEAVHKSSSRQSAEQFIYTGESALIPERRSFYLERYFDSKSGDANFLVDYINYHASIYKHSIVSDAFAKLYELRGSLADELVWKIFEQHITGINNPYLLELSDNYEFYSKKFGKLRVDAKLAKESSYGSISDLERLCEFEGKYTNRRIIEMNLAARSGDYTTLSKIVDELIEDPAIDREKFISSLRFTIRNRSSDLSKLPREWLKKSAGYYQYIAYNLKDRKDPYIHQEYAAILEQIIKLMPQAPEFFPESITNKPTHGKESYSMRPDVLKPKR